jgi:hypothetical protein
MAATKPGLHMLFAKNLGAANGICAKLLEQSFKFTEGLYHDSD